MKNAKRFEAKITVDPSMKERYGSQSLFPHKIERIKTLLKGTSFDKSIKTDSSATPV